MGQDVSVSRSQIAQVKGCRCENQGRNKGAQEQEVVVQAPCVTQGPRNPLWGGGGQNPRRGQVGTLPWTALLKAGLGGTW